MQELTPQQKKKARKFLKIVEAGGKASDIEIANQILELEEKLDTDISEVKKEIEKIGSIDMTTIRGKPGKDYVITSEDKRQIVSDIRGLIDDHQIALKSASLIEIPIQKIAETASKMVKIPVPKEIDTVSLKKEIVLYTDKAFQASKEENQNAIKEIETTILEKIPKNLKWEEELPKYSFAIRDSLELITEEKEKLAIEAIKDLRKELDELLKKIGTGKSGQVYGGTKLLQYLLDVSISSPSNGQTLVYNSTTGKWENGAGSGGGTWLTPTGTVNGSNKTFTVLSVPTMVATESGNMVDGFGYTYSAGTITMLLAPQDWIRYQ